MNRRDLLRLAALGGAQAMLGTAATANAAASEPFEWEEATIAQLQEAMKSGKTTCAAITQAYLKRIESIDKAGPAINAVIEVNPDAMSIAQSLNEDPKAKTARGPLHGVPILVKDNLDTHD